MQDHTMQHKKKMPAFRCLVIIIDSNIRDKLTEFLTDASIPIYYQMHGVGTVSSDFLNLCGLGDTHKTIMLCIVPKERTRMLLAEMNPVLLSAYRYPAFRDGSIKFSVPVLWTPLSRR